MKHGSITVKRDSVTVKRGSVTVKHDSVTVKRGSVTVKRGSVTVKGFILVVHLYIRCFWLLSFASDLCICEHVLNPIVCRLERGVTLK